MKLTTFIRVAGLAVSMTGLAFAESVVLYDVANNQVSTAGSNTVSFGVSGPNAYQLVGTNIAIPTLSRLSPGPISGLNCTGCVMSFISGTLTSYTSGGIWPNSGGWGMNPVWNFGSGGTALITGGIDINNDGDLLDAVDIAAGSTLLSGSFINSTTVSGNPTTDLVVATGLILNSQNQQLNQFFFGQALAGPVWTGSLNLQFSPFGTPKPPGGNAGLQTFTSEGILNGSLVNSTPEPGSVLLFSSITGILGFGLVMRRRRANQTNS